MGDHHNHHNNHRHSTSNHNNSHSQKYSHQHQNRYQSRPPQKPAPHMVHQYERRDLSGPEKPSRFSGIKQRFTNRFAEKTPTREQIEQLKVKAEHARYSADVKVHKAREAKAERENPSGWRRLFAATMQQPQKTGRVSRVGTRRPTASQYYGGQGRGPPQMGDSMLIGPGSFSGNNLLFSPEGGQVGDNMLGFQANSQAYHNDLLSFQPSGGGGGGKRMMSKKSESMGMTFGEGAMSMFKFS